MDKTPEPSPKRILLTGVFGPYGVDDAYGRKENIMELFHNQVTKAQGLASFRFHHRSFGLYFIAANLDADVTVLDFPSQKRFERELARGYDIVGISFIAPNYLKAQEMARMTRELAADATIIIGGHGAAIEGVEELIECDHVVKGEGISWMRSFLGQDPEAPLVHPALPSTERNSIYGVPVPGVTANLLVTGVGCVNACNFCCTSHFFGRRYTPFIGSGRDLFKVAERIADLRGSDTFFVMDENFLKDRERALELVAEMERNERFFKFHVFSSAETITAFGVENLVRLGAQFVWVGFESQSDQSKFGKNQGIDARKLVRELRDHGISVLASGILCMEHHTPENMQEDIDFMVGIEADMTQFMLYTPLPVTALYEDHKARGLLRKELPMEEWHGQKFLNYYHPAFTGDAPERWINGAFQKEYEHNSSSMYRVIDTTMRGYRTLSAMADRDACLEARRQQLEERLRAYAPMLPVIARYPVNELERTRALELDEELPELLGPLTMARRLRRMATVALATRWNLRLKLKGDAMQPKTIVTHFDAKNRQGAGCPVPFVDLEPVRDYTPPIAAAAFASDESGLAWPRPACQAT